MRALVSTLMLLAGIISVSAHDSRKGPNGGPLVDAGARYHVELIAKGGEEVTVVLSDANDKPVSAAGFKANAILLVGGKPQRFALEPAEGARLTGKATVAIPAGVKGAIQLTAPDGTTAQAKF